MNHPPRLFVVARFLLAGLLIAGCRALPLPPSPPPRPESSPAPSPTPPPTASPTPRVVAALLPEYIRILDDKTAPWQTRAAAARAIGLVLAARGGGVTPTATAAAVEALMDALAEELYVPESYLDLDVAGALEAAGPAALSSTPHLLELLAPARGAAIQNAAHAALKAITGEDYGVDMDRWRNWWARRP